jgi:hypothetical protein
MLMDARKISEIIREKKKKAMMEDPELVHTDARPDMNPNEAYDMEQKGRIEETLDVPHKSNAEETEAMEMSQGGNVGLSPEEKMRMERLRKYFDKMDL